MAKIKATLAAGRLAATGEAAALTPRESSVAAVLKDLETGHISYEKAMESIKKLQ
jgi:hypothetical protein